MITKLIYLTNAWNESNESWILEKILFWCLERYKIFLSMTTFKHICHQITALILLIFVNANWFYHIFWRHVIKRIKSIKESTICANSLTYILVLETEKLFIIKTWLNETTLNKKTSWTFSISMCKNFFIKKKKKENFWADPELWNFWTQDVPFA